MNRHFHWWTTKLRPPVGVEPSLEAVEIPGVIMARGEMFVGAAVDLLVVAIKTNVVEGEAGGTGRRFVSFMITLICSSIFVQNNRTRESSVVISPQWSMLEEIEFHRLAKLRLEVDEPEEL